MSIFSIISEWSFELLTVSSKGYRSTITRSMSGILKFLESLISESELVLSIPPKTLGCKVLTLPFNMEG